MNASLHQLLWAGVAIGLSLASSGCERETRSRTYDDRTQNIGSANEPKNTGDTRAKALEDGKSPSASPTGLSRDARPEETPGPDNLQKASGAGIDADGDSGQSETK